MPLFSVYLYSVFAVIVFLRCIIVMACPLHISCGLWPFPQEKPVSNQDFRPTLCYLKFAPAWLLHTSNPCLIYPPGDQYAIAFAGPRAARPGERQAPPRPPGRSAGGAAAFWGRGQRPRPQNMPAAGQSPAAGGWAAPTRRRPPRRWDFHQRQKRQRKSQAPRSMGPGTRNVGRKVRGNGSTPRAKPLPTPYGQRRLKPPRRGLRTPGNRARCCATLAVRAGPPWA